MNEKEKRIAEMLLNEIEKTSSEALNVAIRNYLSFLDTVMTRQAIEMNQIQISRDLLQ